MIGHLEHFEDVRWVFLLGTLQTHDGDSNGIVANKRFSQQSKGFVRLDTFSCASSTNRSVVNWMSTFQYRFKRHSMFCILNDKKWSTSSFLILKLSFFFLLGDCLIFNSMECGTRRGSLLTSRCLWGKIVNKFWAYVLVSDRIGYERLVLFGINGGLRFAVELVVILTHLLTK